MKKEGGAQTDRPPARLMYGRNADLRKQDG